MEKEIRKMDEIAYDFIPEDEIRKIEQEDKEYFERLNDNLQNKNTKKKNSVSYDFSNFTKVLKLSFILFVVILAIGLINALIYRFCCKKKEKINKRLKKRKNN